MEKPKLLHISLGCHNTGMWKAFDRQFETRHFDWQPHRHNIHLLNQMVVDIFNDFKPDVVFMQLQEGGIISLATARHMTQNSITVNWTGDVRHPIPHWYYELGQHIDITLFSNMYDVEMMNKVGINSGFLQVGFDETIFTPEGKRGYYPPIIFLGSNYCSTSNFPLSALRQQMVSRLVAKYGQQFMAYGHNWQETQGKEVFLNPTQEAEAYRTALISINLSHFDYGRYSSDRMLRLMGSGGFCLSHNFKQIEDDYVVGKHVAVWNGIEDLLNKIDYYLEAHNEREKIRKAGCEFVRANYTWDNVMIELKKLLGFKI